MSRLVQKIILLLLLCFVPNDTLGQVAQTIDFGNVSLGRDSIALAEIPNPILLPPFILNRAQATFVRIVSGTPESFQFVHDTTIIDITNKPNSFRIRFVPQDSGTVNAQLFIARETNATYQGVPSIFRDTIIFLLRGRGVAVLIPPTRVVAPPSIFILFPINHTVNAINIDTSLAQSCGPYSETEWRMFSFVPSIGRYVEYSGPSGNKRNPSAFFQTFNRANAYFFISRVERSFNIPGSRLISIQDGIITLNQGWNLVASPYSFDIDWDYVIQSLKLQGLVSKARAFLPNGFEQTGNADIILSGQGYFILSKAALLQIPVKPVFVTSFKKFLSNQIQSVQRSDEASWSMNIEMHLGIDGFTNVIGHRADAIDGFDYNDFPMPPLPMKKSYLIIHETTDADYPEYIDDFRKLKPDGDEWEIKIFRNTSETRCVLHFDSKNLPRNYLTSVIDEKEHTFANITETIRYELTFEKNELHRSLRLLTGTQQFIEQRISSNSQAFLKGFIYPVYPNPARRGELGKENRVQIRFTLPLNDFIHLSIVDALGRNIKVITNSEMNSGDHSFEVSLENIPQGLYFIRLVALSNWFDVKKFVVVR